MSNPFRFQYRQQEVRSCRNALQNAEPRTEPLSQLRFFPVPKLRVELLTTMHVKIQRKIAGILYFGVMLFTLLPRHLLTKFLKLMYSLLMITGGAQLLRIY